MAFDIIIKGGTVYDGTGAPGIAAAVAIKDGKIAAIGKPEGPATTTIDASGRAVSPGFVDVHTHYDAQVMWDRMLTISPWHGVTTAVIGNCGFGVAPTKPAHRRLILQTLEKVEGMALQALQAGLGDDWPFETFPQYLDAVEQRGSAINLGVLFGHTPLRLFVMGQDATERAATADEVSQMRKLVREAMDAGAIGFGTSKSSTHNGFGGKPVPSRLASNEEIDSLASVMGEIKRGLMQVTIGREYFMDEMAAVSRKHGIPVTWTALLAGLRGPGSHRRYLEQTAAQRQSGAFVIPQVSCRPLNFEFNFADPFPFETMKLFNELSAADARTPGARLAAYADPAFRAKMRETLTPVMQGWAQRSVIAFAPSALELEEQNLADVAAARGTDPIDFALDLSIANKLAARFRMAVLNFDESEVAELLDNDQVVVALSDAGAHASQLCDACYATYMLKHWVREKKTLTLERAIHMLTGKPAELFGITDRGLLQIGKPADVVVFDPATVGDGKLKRVYDLPAAQDRLISEASGIDAVIVNGTLLRRNGRDALQPNARLPGRVLRAGKAA